MTRTPTTVAIQTPPGRGGIAVLVLAGPEAGEILARAFRPLPSHAGAPQGALQLGRLLDGERVVDEAIVARRGQAVEVNIHGGPAAAAAALHLFRRLGADVQPAPAAATDSFPTGHPRQANPAIGREMLQALAGARSRMAAAALAQQWSAGLSELARDAAACCPAAAPDARRRIAGKLRDAADRLPVMQRLLRPAEVVLAGPPNVGKSTLANALVGGQVSIVHPAAGTTRDWVREPAVLRGVGVYVTDTAGLWELAEGIDAEAVRRAGQRIAKADVVLLLSAGVPGEMPAWLGETGVPRLEVASKCDVCPPFEGADAAVSAVTGEGLDALAGRILAALGLGEFDPAAAAAFTDRQARLLRRAADACEAGRARDAAAALGELLGGQADAPAAR